MKTAHQYGHKTMDINYLHTTRKQTQLIIYKKKIKVMKKSSILFSALALFALSFTACKDSEPEVIIEDGFYVAGSVTGSDALNVDYRLAPGVNEVNNDDVVKRNRAGMYEKYVALEANKEFYLLLKEGSVETRYGATLANKELKGENEQGGSAEKPFIIQKGSLVKGATSPALKVSKSGLYHIVLDLNLDKALDLTGGAQVIIAPVEWGVRGVNGDWGWKKMKSPTTFNKTTMVWDTTIATTSAGTYKLAYGGGWKIQLDDAGKVKANTNLGTDMKQGGTDMDLPKGKNIKLTLTWNLKSGEISKSYAYAVTGEIIIEDPKLFVVGFSGNAFGTNTNPPAEWGDPSGATLAVYDAAASTVTNTTTKAGTYVYNISNLKMEATKEFKVRYNGAWIGTSGATIAGETFGGTDNFIVNTTATYSKAKFEVVWSGSKATSIKVTFTK